MNRCKYCHALLERKTLKGGRLEPLSLFNAREFCNKSHATLFRKYGAMERLEPSFQTGWVLKILRSQPEGVTRKNLAFVLGLSDRAMRRAVEFAANEMLGVNPPVILGFCSKQGVYKIAQSQDEALDIWWTSAGRAYKLISKQRKIKQVIKETFGMTEQGILLKLPEAAGVV